MEKILQKSHEDICKDILNMVDNKKVIVELEEKSKTSLYVFLNDTIYISNKTDNKRSKDEQNKSKVLVIAHECAHSIQPKLLHIANFIASNLEMILFTIVLIVSIFFKKYEWLVNTYVTVSIFAIFVRWYLEINATVNSVKITSKYMSQSGISKDKVKGLFRYYKRELLKALPLFISYLFVFRIIRLILILVI